MKKLINLFLTLIFILCINIYTYADDEITVLVNNTPVVSEQKPVMLNGNVYVPLRPVAEAMGCEVTWIQAAKTANIKNLTTIVSFQVDNTKITKLERSDENKSSIQEINAAPKNINGSVYLPLRAMAESFGAKVGWDQSTKTAMIMLSESISYAGNKMLSTFCGNGIKQRYDGDLDKMQLLSPESIDIAADGTIYISDGGVIRKISNSKSETVEFEPSYITSSVARCYGNDVYFLTNAFENEEGVKYYGIVKLSGSSADGVFLTEALDSRINDFQIDSKGNIYLIFNNVGVGKTYLGRLNIQTQNVDYLKEIDDGFGCMAIDDSDNIYLGNTIKGSIYYYNVPEGTLKLCSGVDEQTKFVDGSNEETFFYEPKAMEYSDGYLYIVDYNLVRRLAVNGGVALNSETLAGKLTAETDPQTVNGHISAPCATR